MWNIFPYRQLGAETPPLMDFQLAALTIIGATGAYALYKLSRSSPVSDVPGPENPSWIHGHMWWWSLEEMGAVEKRLIEQYGTTTRWNASLGEECLWTVDPKAIHHILKGSNTLYVKPTVVKERVSALMDWGLVSVEGDVHKRQRRAMTPAFGLVEAKALYPYFIRCSNCLADKWHETILNTGSGQAAVIDINPWLGKATLDAIGAGAFDYDFGALENTENKFTKTYGNLAFGAFGVLSKQRMFMFDALKWAPEGFTTWILNNDKSPGMARLRENRACAHEVAAKLIDEKRQELKDGNSRRDVLSLLVKSNTALRPEWRLNDEEIIAQIRTIIFAGHETTSRTLTFGLWELAKNRQVQERLRAEIRETLAKIRARGDSDFTANDFDSMPYLLAVGKEMLRVYPVATDMTRVAKKDDVLPLSRPVVGISGKVYQELPIPAGTAITMSTIGYNWNEDLWGPDASEFRPDRWLNMDGKPELPLGVYGNLLTFSGGPRSCIGWRFAVTEMHTFLVTLIRQFDFSALDNGQYVKRLRPVGIAPMVVGEEGKGPQMPLKVTILGNE